MKKTKLRWQQQTKCHSMCVGRNETDFYIASNTN